VRIETTGRSTLVCRPDELVQAFRLLLDNCLEAAQPPPEVVVRIQEENRKLCIRIEDSGPGIEAGLLKRLFEPFVTSKPGHEGLGLYLCRSLVERNSGSLEIRSTAGTGTAALLAFPLQGAEA
jgi:two-component system sensor histidine kinase FlrB